MGQESDLKDQHGATQVLILRSITTGQHLNSMEFSHSMLIQEPIMPTKGGQLCGMFLATFALQYSMSMVAVPVAITATAP